MSVATVTNIRYGTGWFFNLFRPKFRAKKKNVAQLRRIFCTSKISWHRISDWLSIVFHFGTGNWKGQLKEPPCITGTVRVFQTIFKCLHFDCLFLLCLHLQSLELCGSPSGFSGELSNVPPLCCVAGQSLKASKEESCIISGRALGTDHCQVLYPDEK